MTVAENHRSSFGERRFAIAALTLWCLLGCGSSTRTTRARADAARASWVVIAPHPDDDVLIAGGVLARAVEAGEGVAVIFMTNGDYDCAHDGLRRQRESVAALEALGVPEERLFFLGYPDGGLGRLGLFPFMARRLEHGRCKAGGTTYGAHGFGGRDYHTARFGAAARYTHSAAVSDLAFLLGELRPSDVVVTHGADTHPDHAATYALFRSALDDLAEAPRVHRAFVHTGDCWPTGITSGEPCPPGGAAVSQPVPPLSGRLAGYEARERLPVPASCQNADPDGNPKIRAIAAHASQTRGDESSYLFSFARRDEAFHPETFQRRGDRWEIAAAPSLSRATVVLRFLAAEPRVLPVEPPLSIAARLGDPRRAGDEDVRTVSLSFLDDATGGYRLDVDGDRREAVLKRKGPGGALSVLQTWPLPHDLWSARAFEDVKVAVQGRPDEGSVTEITLRVREEIVGVAVDVGPPPRGQLIEISGAIDHHGVDLVVRGLASGRGAENQDLDAGEPR